MKRLGIEVKRRIVEHLACYNSPAETARLVNEEFGVALTPRHVRAYDPTSFQFAGARRWLGYYDVVRARFHAEIDVTPIRYRAFRLAKLQSMLDRALEREQFKLAAQILEQAAKEMGGIYVRQ